jgi:hypothetical protein
MPIFRTSPIFKLCESPTGRSSHVGASSGVWRRTQHAGCKGRAAHALGVGIMACFPARNHPGGNLSSSDDGLLAAMASPCGRSLSGRSNPRGLLDARGTPPTKVAQPRWWTPTSSATASRTSSNHLIGVLSLEHRDVGVGAYPP